MEVMSFCLCERVGRSVAWKRPCIRRTALEARCDLELLFARRDLSALSFARMCARANVFILIIAHHSDVCRSYVGASILRAVSQFSEVRELEEFRWCESSSSRLCCHATRPGV